jgi:hypothetical protein
MTTLPPRRADCLEIWEPQTPGTLRGCSRPVKGQQQLGEDVFPQQLNVAVLNLPNKTANLTYSN